jgi:hypothetical protein
VSIQPFQPSPVLPATWLSDARPPARSLQRRVAHTQEDAALAVHRVLASSFVASIALPEIERLSIREAEIVNNLPGDIDQRYRVAARCAAVVNAVAEVSYQEVMRVGTCPRTVRGCRQ